MAEHNKSLAMDESKVYGLSPATMAGPGSDEQRPPIFPSFHYEGSEELDIPEEGTMTIRYKQTREVSEHKVGKPHWYECDVTVLEIVSTKGESKAPARSGSEAADALDRLMSEHEENE